MHNRLDVAKPWHQMSSKPPSARESGWMNPIDDSLTPLESNYVRTARIPLVPCLLGQNDETTSNNIVIVLVSQMSFENSSDRVY
jgi:hypothetical protein